MNLATKMWLIGQAEQFHANLPLPKGACDCGLMMTGIPNGCQPHVHTNGVGEVKRVDLKDGDWVIPETDPLDFKHYMVCPPAVFDEWKREVERDAMKPMEEKVRELYNTLHVYLESKP